MLSYRLCTLLLVLLTKDMRHRLVSHIGVEPKLTDPMGHGGVNGKHAPRL